MRSLSIALIAVSLTACTDDPFCLAGATLAEGATTVSTGTAVDSPTRLNPAGCELALAMTSELRQRPAGSTAILTKAGSQQRFVPDVPGTYVVRRTLEDGQIAELRVVVIPAGGFEKVAETAPCFRVAVGANGVFCSNLGAKGYPSSSRVYRREDLEPLSRPLAVTARPAFASGRYFVASRSTVTILAELPDGDVETRAEVTPFEPRYETIPFVLAASGPRAVAVADDGRMRIIDATDPAAPRVAPVPSLPFTGAVRLAFAGNTAVVVGRSLGGDAPIEVAVLDLTDPAAAKPFLAPFAWSPIAFAGSRLAVVQNHGLDLFDVSTNRGLSLTMRNDAAAGRALAATTDRIAVANSRGVVIAAAADLQPLLFVPETGVEQVALEGDRLFTVGAGVLREYRLTR